MLAQGGMTPLGGAARRAPSTAPRYLGLDRDLGSLEAGKLADLIVLEQDPLADIRNSTAIRYTMVNGRLYDAKTGNAILPTPAPRAAFYWETVAPR